MLAAAETAFPDLSPAEKKLVQCFAEGKRANFDTDQDPATSARAALVRWILANGSAGDGSHMLGLFVTNLRVCDEDLKLDGIHVDFPVVFKDCHFRKLLLRDGRLVTLRLSGSHCRNGIAGDRLNVAHGLLLNEGFRSDETVWLPSIIVGGDLNCDDGMFAGGKPGNSALLLDGARVEGRIFLRNALATPALKPDAAAPLDSTEAPPKAGRVSAQGARIDGNFVCIGATLGANSAVALNLGSAAIGGDAAFEHVTAAGEFLLRQARFDGTVTFRGAKLAKRLDLTRSSVGGDLSLGRPTPQEEEEGKSDTPARLGKELVLTGATVRGVMDMGTAGLEELKLADLSRASIAYFDDSRVNWPADTKVLLEGIVLGGLAAGKPVEQRLAWLASQGQTTWSPQPYNQVAAALRLAGEEDPARDVSIERERDRCKYGGLNWISRVWNALLDATIRYGYRPYFAFVWAFVVIGLGWLVFTGFFGPVHFTHEDKPPHLYRFVYSVDAFLPIVDLGQSSAHSPIGFMPNLALWLEICLGWLLTTLGAVGVTGLIRKD